VVRRLRRALVGALVAAALVATTGADAGLKGTLRDEAFHSRALSGTLHFEIYLPSDYGRSGRRYPVVYFLHGLPAGSRAFRGARTFARRLEATGRKAILVGPQGARDGDDDPEYLDWGTGRNWETALASELPSYVDSHFRTIPQRRGRAVVGLSAGGYGATLLGLHRLSRFAAVESWSGYFHPTDRTGRKALDLGSRQANRHASAHTFVGLLKRAFANRPTFFAFYVGTEDTRFRGENVQLHRELAAARVPHLFALYSGGHSQTLWQRHASAWLRLALEHLAPAR
jgi:putative tributyrin esterase